MPNDSFQKEDISIIKKIISDFGQSVLEDIDNNLEAWIIGDKDEVFFKKKIHSAIKHKSIIDPFDELPCNKTVKLRHIAVINNCSKSGKGIEAVYGNSQRELYDFASCVFFRLANEFPSNKNASTISLSANIH